VEVAAQAGQERGRMVTFALPALGGAAPNGVAEPLGTWPNLVTLVRTVVAVVVGAVAIARSDVVLLGVAYAAYWAGDVADGWLARRLDQETRTGAVFDIVGDRACTVLLCAGLVAARPGAWLVGAVFLVSFAVVDTMLSLAFLRWDLLGPNDFHRVDRTVWLVNWSPLAKAVNTAGVVALTVLGLYPAALLLAVAVLAVKVGSGLRVVRLLVGPRLHVTSP
jgi:cardiolipin synthase (CMP-forming)